MNPRLSFGRQSTKITVKSALSNDDSKFSNVKASITDTHGLFVAVPRQLSLLGGTLLAETETTSSTVMGSLLPPRELLKTARTVE